MRVALREQQLEYESQVCLVQTHVMRSPSKRRAEKKRKEKKRKEKKRKEKKRKEKKRKEKKRKDPTGLDSAFRRQFSEKPSVIPGCHVPSYRVFFSKCQAYIGSCTLKQHMQ